MRLPAASTLAVALLFFCQTPGSAQGKVSVPLRHFLLEHSADKETGRTSGEDGNQISKDVPLVMRLLFTESERVNHSHSAIHRGGDSLSVARSIRPLHLTEEGIQKVVIDFPKFTSEDLMPGIEGWLVFQLRESYILANNCTQMLSVYAKDKSTLWYVTAVPLIYKTGDPLLVVNVTSSMRLWRKKNRASYVAMIKDTTAYTTDRHLRSFSNYIDCTLGRACEVLELHDPDTSPVLLVLSSELAAHAASSLMNSVSRTRRSVHAGYLTDLDNNEIPSPETESHQDSYCHLMEWTVNVEQLGWDWLIYPERLPLNLCVGRCPDILGYHYNTTSHAIYRGLYRSQFGNDTIPGNTGPCCVPVKFRRFSMLRSKRTGVISLETNSDLQAIACGCR